LARRTPLALREASWPGSRRRAERLQRKEGGEVEGLYAEQEALHGAAHEIRADQAESKSDGGKKYAVTNDEADDPVAGCAECHAERDLMRRRRRLSPR
jgi:hypothetical protein